MYVPFDPHVYCSVEGIGKGIGALSNALVGFCNHHISTIDSFLDCSFQLLDIQPDLRCFQLLGRWAALEVCKYHQKVCSILRPVVQPKEPSYRLDLDLA